MPELPDLANLKRYLDATALHRTIDRVTVREPRVLAGTGPAFARRLTGRRFEASARHGKHLFVRLDDGGWTVFHFGMTGRLAAYKDEADEPRHSRIRFDFADGGHLSYVNQRLLGEVDAVEDRAAFVAAKGLGPDALDDALDEAAFRERLAGRRGAIKSALMDQSLVAGIGNLCADEILFQARLHPKTSVASLDAAALGQVYRKMRSVLATIVERSAGTEWRLDRMPKGWILPRREAGAPCPRCGTPIEVVKVSGRTSYLCPKCQPMT